MSTRRDDILAAIKTELLTIKPANGYNLTVKTVDDKDIKMPEELNNEQFPAAFIIDGDERKITSDLGDVESTLDIIVTGYVRSDSDAQAERRKFQQDVERAVCKKRLLGKDYTVDMNVTDIKTDRGLMSPYSIFDISFAIKYRHAFGTP